jgi:hypothetical protein
MEPLEDRLAPATLIVNTTADVVNPSDGTLSLRDAISAVDAGNVNGLTLGEQGQVTGTFGSNDIIQFAISGSGVQTILPTSALPTITKAVVIDGYSQPGATPNTLATGDNAVLLIQLNGSSAGKSVCGLIIDAANCTVQGLVVNGFSSNGIVLQGPAATKDLIQGNFIGTNAAGTAALANSGDGVSLFSGAANNTIGGLLPSERNLISGNASGIHMSGTDTPPTVRANLVEGNFIGTDATGTVKIGNGNGIYLFYWAVGNTIGGDVSGARNLISGNGFGIVIKSSGSNLVAGNFIGTDINGTSALANGTGIAMSVGSGANTIGGTNAGAGNLISGNSDDGVSIGNGSGILLAGNLIGTDITGTNKLGNGGNGIYFLGATGDTVGGTVSTGRNIISGNGKAGIYLDALPQSPFGVYTSAILIEGNYVGLDVNGTASLGNGMDGIVLNTAFNNTIGGTSPEAGNIISGNVGRGIVLSGITANPVDAATKNLIEGNFIGTQADGTTSLDNGLQGIYITNGANANTIGGTSAGAGNIIAFNSSAGVLIGSDVYNPVFPPTPDTSGGAGNALIGNSIFSTGGIILNGAGNNLQPAPTLASVAGSNIIQFSLTDTVTGANNYRIEFFANDANDPEGKTLLGFVLLSGNGGIATGQFSTTNDPSVITATATNLVNGNLTDTSQFSGFCKVNHPPVATAQSLNALENAALLVTLTATDLDGDPLTYSIVNGPTNGTLTGTGPNVTYTPAANYLGPDSFTFKANDGALDSNIATVNISVQTTITDNFNGPDAPALGPNWEAPPLPTQMRFTWHRRLAFAGFSQQNYAAVSDGSTFSGAQIKGLLLQNPTLQADVNAGDSQTLAVGVMARVQSDGNAYVAVLTNSGNAEIWLYHGATQTVTVLASAAAGGTSGTLQFVVNVSSLTLTFTGSGPPVVVNATETTLTAPGGVGIFAWGPNGIIDNFSVSGS